MKFSFFKKKEREIPERIFEAEVIKAVDIIAPSSIAVSPNSLRIGERFAKSFFIFSYPRELSTAWLSPIINLDIPMDISFFIHPIETGDILKQLRKSVTEVQAEIMEREEKGLIREPSLEIAYRDLETLRDRLQTAQERMFKLGLYLTVYADKEESLREIENTLRSILEARLIYIKPALYQQREGFISTSPYGLDQLTVHTSINTEPLSSAFPFVSFDLSSNEGILYGINMHNSSLILFDRFSLENANLCCFGVTGSGKSYALKLEILRYLVQHRDPLQYASCYSDPDSQMPEPLCAIYEPRVRPLIFDYLKYGVYCPRKLLINVDAHRLTLPIERALENANHHHEFESLRLELQQGSRL